MKRKEFLKSLVALAVVASPMAALITSAIPTGYIHCYGGSDDNIPDGWLICDGTYGTPDLRANFQISKPTEDGKPSWTMKYIMKTNKPEL